MKRSILIRPEVQIEVQETFDWYEERAAGLGFELLRAADACLSKIKRNPLAFPVVHVSVRRALLRKFPYAILYLVTDQQSTNRRHCLFPRPTRSDRLASARRAIKPVCVLKTSPTSSSSAAA
jgi:hypothetical protein